jgi:hypothetical protein
MRLSTASLTANQDTRACGKEAAHNRANAMRGHPVIAVMEVTASRDSAPPRARSDCARTRAFHSGPSSGPAQER